MPLEIERKFLVICDECRAGEMLERLCVGPIIEKTRYHVPHDGMVWEVDVFSAAAEGLVLAKVEMRTVDETFDLPDWVGLEVTHDPRFRNSAIGLIAPGTEKRAVPLLFSRSRPKW